MIKFTHKELLEKSAVRKPGYIETVLKNSTKIGDDLYEISPEINRQIVEEYKITTTLIKKEDLEKNAKSKGQGYKIEIQNNSKILESGDYEINILFLDEIERKYRNPSVLEMIKNATQAAEEAVKNGLNVRNKEETKECLEKCANCQFLIVDSFRCGVCGCFLSYKVKLKDWHCPKGKW